MILIVTFIGLAGCGPGGLVQTVPAKTIVASGGHFSQVTAAGLKKMLLNKDFILVNVHTPYEGEIDHTDLFIVYNEIEQNQDQLPDKDAKIVVYCRSGGMSKIAAETLVKLGYTHVYDLDGGMNAWEAAGYPIFTRKH
jgi:rhodanese-related sulfurtransferase